jgi:hypothetical protein
MKEIFVSYDFEVRPKKIIFRVNRPIFLGSVIKTTYVQLTRKYLF